MAAAAFFHDENVIPFHPICEEDIPASFLNLRLDSSSEGSEISPASTARGLPLGRGSLGGAGQEMQGIQELEASPPGCPWQANCCGAALDRQP